MLKHIGLKKIKSIVKLCFYIKHIFRKKFVKKDLCHNLELAQNLMLPVSLTLHKCLPEFCITAFQFRTFVHVYHSVYQPVHECRH